MTLERGVAMIVDETKTGLGITGLQWGHNHWYLQESPDFVTFGGKAGLNGYYAHIDFHPEIEQENFDFSKLDQYNNTWRIVQRYNYMDITMDTSSFLKLELNRIGVDNGRIDNVRGYGTFIGFDVDSLKTAGRMEAWFQRHGIHLYRCAPLTFGLRPSLSLIPRQAAALRDSLKYFSPYV